MIHCDYTACVYGVGCHNCVEVLSMVTRVIKYDSQLQLKITRLHKYDINHHTHNLKPKCLCFHPHPPFQKKTMWMRTSS